MGLSNGGMCLRVGFGLITDVVPRSEGVGDRSLRNDLVVVAVVVGSSLGRQGGPGLQRLPGASNVHPIGDIALDRQ